ILGSILLYVAGKHNIFFGESLLFVFSLGAGMSLILAGTFSGFLSSLPKSGAWLNAVKKLIGFVLLGLAEYYFVKAGQLF
ncbi:MAG: hypothetical protein HQL18_03030, partial [Candidatus Omnitrophica bacterium]|nr:hypothetical protein [Candidatus Omnitrophota bacterium]